MGAPIDLTGQRFGRLLAVHPTTDKGLSDGRRWVCHCDCGGTTQVFANQLRYGHAQSCGCKQRDIVRERATVHGGCGTPTYRAWQAMRRRCDTPTNISYANYGGRGITVCDRWHSFENFRADMGERPAGTTLDRYPDNDGNYEPGNCRWATKEQQDNNKRTSVFVTIGDRRMTYAQWGRELNIDQCTLRQRYRKFGTFEPQPRGPKPRSKPAATNTEKP